MWCELAKFSYLSSFTEFNEFFILTGVKHFGQATPLLLTVAVIEISDIAFAVGSHDSSSMSSIWTLLVNDVMRMMMHFFSFSLG